MGRGGEGGAFVSLHLKLVTLLNKSCTLGYAQRVLID